MSDKNEQQDANSSHPAQTEELSQTGGSQNASANQGGTTDMDNESLVAGRTSATERGSGISTKRNVTGSDYDGQVAT
ncbi:MAG TPA: hypothetical protein VM884_06150 [Flavisolibacter sp.]|jgi:hypothetical protein|nr:hypothetical protein [Flavisolibacter sp.]